MLLRATLSLSLLMLSAVPVLAGIVQTSPSVSVIVPPPDESSGKFESNSTIYAFSEEQDIFLLQSVTVDISLSGTAPSSTSQNLSPGALTSGSRVSSYFVHFDAVGSPTNAVITSGSIRFDDDVIGLIVLPASLEASNSILGLPGVTYDNSITGGGAEGLEIFAGGAGKDFNDQITLSADRHTVSFNLRDGGAPDDFRVVTMVPEPSSLTCALIGLIAMTLYYFRRG